MLPAATEDKCCITHMVPAGLPLVGIAHTHLPSHPERSQHPASIAVTKYERGQLLFQFRSPPTGAVHALGTGVLDTRWEGKLRLHLQQCAKAAASCLLPPLPLASPPLLPSRLPTSRCHPRSSLSACLPQSVRAGIMTTWRRSSQAPRWTACL